MMSLYPVEVFKEVATFKAVQYVLMAVLRKTRYRPKSMRKDEDATEMFLLW
jgi:hypothetical protein